MKRKLLLGLTGSIATVLVKKLAADLSKIGTVSLVFTENALKFISEQELLDLESDYVVYTDRHEWHNVGRASEICHIQLRNDNDILVIAPCSANTLAKIANGICDNLLSSIVRAWYPYKPILLAPAMNTQMWNHPITKKHLDTFTLFSKNNSVIQPQNKTLACGEQGIGALAEIEDITKFVSEIFRWRFPILYYCSGIPVGDKHPGAFATQRKFEKHTGVDLYADDGTYVHPVEDGIVVCIEHFTGEQVNSPWWENTDCVLVEGASGVVCYGEIRPTPGLKVGDVVSFPTPIGTVKRVLKVGKERSDIEGHKTSMLHLELYPAGTVKPSSGFDEAVLRDPTPFLLNSEGRPLAIFTNENKAGKTECDR